MKKIYVEPTVNIICFEKESFIVMSSNAKSIADDNPDDITGGDVLNDSTDSVPVPNKAPTGGVDSGISSNNGETSGEGGSGSETPDAPVENHITQGDDTILKGATPSDSGGTTGSEPGSESSPESDPSPEPEPSLEPGMESGTAAEETQQP